MMCSRGLGQRGGHASGFLITFNDRQLERKVLRQRHILWELHLFFQTGGLGVQRVAMYTHTRRQTEAMRLCWGLLTKGHEDASTVGGSLTSYRVLLESVLLLDQIRITRITMGELHDDEVGFWVCRRDDVIEEGEQLVDVNGTNFQNFLNPSSWINNRYII